MEAPLRAEASQANLKKATTTTTKALGADGQSKPIKPQRLTSKAQAKPIKGPPRPFGAEAERKPIQTLGLRNKRTSGTIAESKQAIRRRAYFLGFDLTPPLQKGKGLRFYKMKNENHGNLTNLLNYETEPFQILTNIM